MKKILLLTMQLIFLVVLAPDIQAQKKQTQVIYTCTMHPEVKMDKPGNCPKCGMTLVKKTIKITQPKAAPKKQEATKPKDTVPTKKEIKDMQEMRDMKEMDMRQIRTCICLIK